MLAAPSERHLTQWKRMSSQFPPTPARPARWNPSFGPCPGSTLPFRRCSWQQWGWWWKGRAIFRMNGRKGGTTTKRDGGLQKPSGSQEETPLSPGQGKRWVGFRGRRGENSITWEGALLPGGGGKLERPAKQPAAPHIPQSWKDPSGGRCAFAKARLRLRESSLGRTKVTGGAEPWAPPPHPLVPQPLGATLF